MKVTQVLTNGTLAWDIFSKMLILRGLNLSSVIATGILLLTPLLVEGKVFLDQQEALKLAFPEGKIERKIYFLTTEQAEKAGKLAGEKLPSLLYTAYEARKEGRLIGVAYFDAHQVRTLPEVVMVAVSARGRVKRVEVLSFSEPQEYLAPGIWYAQFDDKILDSELQLKKSIRSITGATLTARVTTRAVRRVLAVNQVLTEHRVLSESDK